MCARALTQCAKSGHCACSTHAKSGPLTKSGHTRGLLLVLASVSNSSSLKTQEMIIQLWGWPESALGIAIISRIILYTNKSPLLVKITYIVVSTSHASVDHPNIDGPSLAVKCVRKFGCALGEEVSVCVCVCVCACALHYMPRVDTFDVRCWFCLQFRTHNPRKPRN